MGSIAERRHYWQGIDTSVPFPRLYRVRGANLLTCPKDQDSKRPKECTTFFPKTSLISQGSLTWFRRWRGSTAFQGLILPCWKTRPCSKKELASPPMLWKNKCIFCAPKGEMLLLCALSLPREERVHTLNT